MTHFLSMIFHISLALTLIFNIACQNRVSAQQNDGFALLKANKGNDRFEPSGVAVIDDFAWVVSDRDGWVVAYEIDALQKGGKHKAKKALQLNIPGGGRTKWEAVEWDGKRGLYLLEAISRSIWYCPTVDDQCKGLVQKDSTLVQNHLNEIYQKKLGSDLNYLMLEGLALDIQKDELYLGLRGFHSKSKGYTPSSLLISLKGNLILSMDQGLEIDGVSYGLSGVTMHREGSKLYFWMTWSFENESDTTQKGVGGKLIQWVVDESELKGELKKEQLKLCHSFAYKPEGISVFENKIIVVFDEDKDRKKDFHLTKKQDYAWIKEIQDLKCQNIH